MILNEGVYVIVFNERGGMNIFDVALLSGVKVHYGSTFDGINPLAINSVLLCKSCFYLSRKLYTLFPSSFAAITARLTGLISGEKVQYLSSRSYFAIRSAEIARSRRRAN